MCRVPKGWVFVDDPQAARAGRPPELRDELAAKLGKVPAAGTPYHDEDLLAALKKHAPGGLCFCERCVASDGGHDA